MRRILIACVLVLAACSDDSTPENNPANNTSTNNTSTNNTSTNNTSTNNTSTNNTSTNNTSTNNAATNNNATNNTATNNTATNNTATNNTATNNVQPDMGEVDMADEDMSSFVDPYPDRPLGQCVVASDCPENPNGKVCNQLLPGGSCGACDAFNDLYCDDTCFNGTCITTCQDTDDCPPGLSCTNGRCSAALCVNNICPIPWFDCSASNRCQRISCSEGATCPEGTQCVSGLCMEQRMLLR